MVEYNSRLMRTELTLICGLFAVSLLIRLAFVLPTEFDGLYGQDSYAYYDYAQDLSASLQTGTPLKPFFWPLGYPTLLMVAFSAGGRSPIVAQAVSILMGAGLTPLVYILARQIRTTRVGSLIAAAVMTLCGQAIQSSIVVMSDIPALFWATLSAVLLMRYLTPNSPLYQATRLNRSAFLILSVITLTIAGLTRWIVLILGLPFTLAVLIEWRFHIRWRVTFIALVAAGLVLLPQILYSRTNPYPTLDHAWVEGWSPANFVERSFTNIDGHFDYEKMNAIYYAQPFYDPNYLSPLFTLFGLIGLWIVARRGWQWSIIFGGWIALPYLFLAGIPYQNIRFPLIVFPAVAILVGSGMGAAVTWLKNMRVRQINLAFARWLILCVALLGLWQMWGSANTLVANFINNQQRDKLAAAWVGQNVPADATVYTFGLTLTLQHYTSLTVYELYYETPQTLAQKWQHGQDEYLVLNVWNIENQWVGRDPQLDYHWLRDQRGIDQLGKFGNYTLFKIRG